MAADTLRTLLSQHGLWVTPIENWLAETGLETPDDFRCCSGNAQQAEDRSHLAQALKLCPASWLTLGCNGLLAWAMLMPVAAKGCTRHRSRC